MWYGTGRQVSVLGCLAIAELMNSGGEVWYARHLEKGMGQHGCPQRLSILEKQVLLGMVVRLSNSSIWEVEGK